MTPRTISPRVRASSASRRPTSTAARPPTPASTSSKTNVWPSLPWASTTSRPNRTRDSSPPDATRASGAGSEPDRGRARYAIFCTPCHGAAGDGRGIVVQRGFPQAGDLAADRLVGAPAIDLYRAIGEGHRAMLGMAQMIPPADRWAIVAYVRALQISRDVPVAALPETDRAALEAAR